MSARAFATLTAQNALARLAFSDLYGSLTAGRQNAQEDGAPALRRIAIQPQQTFDSEVLRIRFEADRSVAQNASLSGAETSESLPEPDTDTEEQNQELRLIWTGYYLLSLEYPPSIPARGFAAGKGPLEGVPIDLLLCTKAFAKRFDINLRNPHARFNFFPGNRGLYVAGCSRSQLAQVTVNGEAAHQRPYHLNQHYMMIRLDKLEYVFQWTEFAATADFKEARNRYVTRTIGGPTIVDIDMPTPLLNKRTMGEWTLGGALGAGGQGRVFFASNPLGHVAAIKVIERTAKSHHSVDAELQRCFEVSAFADQCDDSERILRVADVIYTNEEKFSPKAAFDNVAIVMRPMTPQTLADWVGIRSKGGYKGMTMKAAAIFRDALQAVKIMHDGSWLHRDLKPGNIGIVGTPARSALLDLGTTIDIQPGAALQPEPGLLGTVGYLAPELELVEYDQSIDIWAMGVILYYLTYGRHPWNFAINPWRDNKENEKLRPAFQKSYLSAVDEMTKDYKNACQSLMDEYLHLGGLFVEMVRYQWASKNHERRPDIDEVLQHPAWGPLLP